jgi:hypothetical protein
VGFIDAYSNGRIAAALADLVAIKETLRYLRGRTRQSVVGELLAGGPEAGCGRVMSRSTRTRLRAVRGELCDEARMGAPGLAGVLLVTCHQDRPAVLATLDELGFRPMEPEEVPVFRAALAGA